MPTLRPALLLDCSGASLAVITSPDRSYSVTLARTCPFGLCHTELKLAEHTMSRSYKLGGQQHHLRTPQTAVEDWCDRARTEVQIQNAQRQVAYGRLRADFKISTKLTRYMVPLIQVMFKGTLYAPVVLQKRESGTATLLHKVSGVSFS